MTFGNGLQARKRVWPESCHVYSCRTEGSQLRPCPGEGTTGAGVTVPGSTLMLPRRKVGRGFGSGTREQCSWLLCCCRTQAVCPAWAGWFCFLSSDGALALCSLHRPKNQSLPGKNQSLSGFKAYPCFSLAASIMKGCTWGLSWLTELQKFKAQTNSTVVTPLLYFPHIKEQSSRRVECLVQNHAGKQQVSLSLLSVFHSSASLVAL